MLNTGNNSNTPHTDISWKETLALALSITQSLETAEQKTKPCSLPGKTKM